MKFMEDRIKKDAQVRAGNILKVDNFLNHQLDVNLLDEVGSAFYEKFKDRGITKILTVEASGIAIACLTARYFDLPVVFAKKTKSRNLDGDLYKSVVHSFTYGVDNTITLSKKYLDSSDNVLLVDDFLANGKAMRGLTDICHQAGAKVEGIGIVIEKGFQCGGKELRDAGYEVFSLAIVDSMEPDKEIEFRKQD